MTMTKGETAKPSSPAAPAKGSGAASAPAAPTEARASRRSHVPAAGTEHAAAVERAQREMLHEGTAAATVRTTGRGTRTRIGADAVCEAILRQGVGILSEAFHIARTGRPGPVHVDITKDALQQETHAQHPSDDEVRAGLPGFRPTMDGNYRQLRNAAAEIDAAKRPVILAGHGVIHAGGGDELVALAEKTSTPVAWTLLGIGAMDERHPLAYGFMGMHGWKHVNLAIQSADLLIALGMRFDDRVTGTVRTYAPYARIVHVDIDPAEIGKNVAVEVPIVGDAKRVLRAILPMVES